MSSTKPKPPPPRPAAAMKTWMRHEHFFWLAAFVALAALAAIVL
jgi:hypothetical protein